MELHNSDRIFLIFLVTLDKNIEGTKNWKQAKIIGLYSRWWRRIWEFFNG